jgi:ADP-ribose pyrophosphatase YjhB (NUDIX family)
VGKSRTQTGIDFGVRVAIVVEREGSLLLVRHKKPGGDHYWVLPGGRLEPGETIPECARRELAEETGLNGDFLGVLYVSEFMDAGRHTVDITVLAETVGEARLGEDPEVGKGEEPTLREVRWVSVGELAEIELLPPWVKEKLVGDAANGLRAGEVYLRSHNG